MSEPTDGAEGAERDAAFLARTRGVLAELGRRDADAKLDAAFRALAPRRFRWPVVLAAALAGAAIAVLVMSIAPREEAPSAFDGDLPQPGTNAQAVVRRAADGGLDEIATLRDGKPEGERVLFRAGKVVRIEHWRHGRLHGVVTDFDGAGRVVRIQTWADGALTGPGLELDPELDRRAPGTPP